MSVLVHDDGSVVGFTPTTDEERQWFEANVEAEPWQWLGGTLWVDHRYADELAEALAHEGLLT